MLVRWNHFDPTVNMMNALRRHLDFWLDEPGLRSSQLSSGAYEDVGPVFYLREEPTHFVITADVPGLGDSDIHLTLNDNVLNIQGERKLSIPEGYTLHRQERGGTRFTRNVELPAGVRSAEIQATVKQGVLTVRLPREQEAKARQIPISVA